MLLILIKGSPNSPSIVGLPVCGYLPLFYYLFMAVIFFFIYKWIQSTLVSEHSLDQQEIKEMNKNAFNGFLAGLIGSFLGLGGGVILTANWL